MMKLLNLASENRQHQKFNEFPQSFVLEDILLRNSNIFFR